jgi:hypothetical protein
MPSFRSPAGTPSAVAYPTGGGRALTATGRSALGNLGPPADDLHAQVPWAENPQNATETVSPGVVASDSERQREGPSATGWLPAAPLQPSPP